MTSAITEVFDAEFRKVFEVPTSCVVHLPPSRLNITRLVLCRNYRAGERESCAMGANCKFVHADCDYAQLPTHSIHVNYVWRHEDSCIYPRLACGVVLPVYAPRLPLPDDVTSMDDGEGGKNTADEAARNEDVDVLVASEKVLMTAGALAFVENTSLPAPVADGVTLRHCADFCWQRVCKRGEECPDVHALYIDPEAKQGHFKRAPARPLPTGVRAGSLQTNPKSVPATASAAGTTPTAAFAEKDHRRATNSPLPPTACSRHGTPVPPSSSVDCPARVFAASHSGVSARQSPAQSTPPSHDAKWSVGGAQARGGASRSSYRQASTGLTLQWTGPAGGDHQPNGRRTPNPADNTVLTPLQDSLSVMQAHMPTFNQRECSPPERALPTHAQTMHARSTGATSPPPAAPQPAQAFYPVNNNGFMTAVGGYGQVPSTYAPAQPAALRFTSRTRGGNGFAPAPQGSGMPGMDAAAREFYPNMLYSAPLSPSPTTSTAAPDHAVTGAPVIPGQAFPSGRAYPHSCVLEDSTAGWSAAPSVPAPRSSAGYPAAANAAHRTSPPPPPSSSLPSTPRQPCHASEGDFTTYSPQGPELSFRAHRLAGPSPQGSVSNAYLSVTPNTVHLATHTYGTGSSASTNLTPSRVFTPPHAHLNVAAGAQHERQVPKTASSSRLLMAASALGHEGVPAMVLSVAEPAAAGVPTVPGSAASGSHRASRVLCDVHATAADNELSGVLGVSEGALGGGRSRANLSTSNLSASKSVYRHNPYCHAEPRTVLTHQ